MIWWLVACQPDPTPAVELCLALPGLAVHEVSSVSPLLVPEEAQLLASAPHTLGLERVDAQGVEALRARTLCQVVDRDGDQILLERRLPELDAQGTLLDPLRTQRLGWRLREGQVETGMQAARERWDAAQEGDAEARAAQLIALERSFGDPLLIVDVLEANQAAEYERTRLALTSTFVSAEDGVISARLVNGSVRRLASVTVEARFDGGQVVPITLTSVDRGARVPYTVPIPEGETGAVRLIVTDLALIPEMPR